MEILVTGGCGFIGSHLVDRLIAEGHGVTVLDNLSSGKRGNLNAQAKLVEGDVADATLVQSLVAKVDAVFHLAAVASVAAYADEPEACHRTNFIGTQAIFDAARARKTPVIYASSAAIYGDNTTLPLAEDATPQPISAYGRDKLACEVAGKEAWDKYQVPSVGLRFFNVYGPRQDASSPYSGVISKFVANARAGLPLTFFGDGGQTRDFIYVGDVVELLLAAQKNASAAMVYNGCTGFALNLKKLAEVIEKEMNRTLEKTFAPAREGDIQHSRGNPDLAKKELGFIAATPFERGLALLVTSDA